MRTITGMWRQATLLVLGVCMAQPVLAFKADTSAQANRIVAQPAALPAKTVPDAEVRTRKAAAASRSDVVVRWDEERGVPAVVRGLDLLGGAQPAGQPTPALAAAAVPDIRQRAVAVMGTLAGMYGIQDASSEFEAHTVTRTLGGYQHVRLNQAYKGLPVFGGQVIVHFDAQGRARTVNGVYNPIGALGTTPAISGDQALAAARADQNAMGNPAGAVAGQPALVVYARRTDPKLAWQLVLTFDDGAGNVGRWRYWIDAITGAILLSYNDVPSLAPEPDETLGATAGITGAILPGEGGYTVGVQGWSQADAFLDVYYYLYSFTNLWYVKNSGGGMHALDSDAFDYANRVGTSNWAGSDPAEMSTGHTLENMLAYYKTVHGRNSYDNLGTITPANVHYGSKYVNAFWTGTEFFLGDGDGVAANPLAVVDIIGHEYQHGVTEYSAGLIYFSESGQLNESFSDIFGTLLEFHMQLPADGRAAYPNKIPGAADWLLGEDSWKTNIALRDMRMPTNSVTVGLGNEQPSRYHGTYWYYGSGDNGGVHLNNSVQNYFFYLLCEGGQGTNDGVIPFFVPGIGIQTGGKLAYATLTGYMSPDTDYAGAQEAWIACAQDFDDAGVTTNTVVPVTLAWAAVGLGRFSLIVPDEPYTLGGDAGLGIYLPSSKVYKVVSPSLTNATTWGASVTQPWLHVDPASETIPGGQLYGAFTASVDSAVAATLPNGVYRDTITFTNSTGMFPDTRDVVMHIASNYTVQGTTYEWIDPVARGHEPVLIFGGVGTEKSLPFPVKFYDTLTNSSIFISGKGFVSFASAGLASGRNTDLPYWRSPNGTLCPLWDDLGGYELGAWVFYGVEGVAPNRKAVVTWMDVSHEADSSAIFTFQAIIEENPTLVLDNNIVFNYKEVSDWNGVVGGGASATVGLEDEYGALGRVFSANQSTLINECAIRFTHSPVPDSTPPTGRIDVAGRTGAIVYFDIRFSEPVTGLTTNGLSLADSTVPGVWISDGRGGGFRYRVAVSNAVGLGRIALSVLPGAVKDLAGNPNAGFGPAYYVMPAPQTVFADDMESGKGGWNVTTQIFSVIDTRGWKLGVPTYVTPVLNPPQAAPLSAASPVNCWSTSLDGPCPENMASARLTTIPVAVGANPAIEFNVWCGYGTYGFLEVNPGTGWYDVTPLNNDAQPYLFNYTNWTHKVVPLNHAMFGNRTLQVRFTAYAYVAHYPGLYVDDVKVTSDRDPGVWVVSYSPGNGSPSSTAAVTMVAYNSTTNSHVGVTGLVGSPELGVSFAYGTPASYGNLRLGDLGTSAVPVGVKLGSIGNFTVPTIQLTHLSQAGLQFLGQQALPFVVDGVPAPSGVTNVLTAKCAVPGVGVTNWLGQRLKGDGGPTSALFQVIAAGTNRVPQPPLSNGQVSGDDRLLYTSVYSQPWGRFGESGVPADVGQFKKVFSHGLGSNAVVYVRAFDGPSFSASVAYGDSPTTTLAGLESETRDFGGWRVGTPLDYYRDSNGDSIPDGYCVLNGLDPRLPISQLAPEWAHLGTIGSGQFAASTRSPTRVLYRGNFLYALDTGHNKLQVWNRFTGAYVGSYGSTGNGAGQFIRPYGLAMDPRSGTNRLAVVDQGNFRVQVLGFDPATGTNITFLFAFGTNTVFQSPTDVAIAPDGRFYVTDNRDGGRVHVYSPTGSLLPPLATYGIANKVVNYPWGITVGPDGQVIVADTQNNRIQSWSASGVWQWAAGTNGTGAGQLKMPRDVAYGPGGLLYVADTMNARFAIYRTNGTHVASLAMQGDAVDPQTVEPSSLAPVLDSNVVYVADTGNCRILTVKALFDVDGDGMDDVWEILNGLNPNDPADGLVDYNGNGYLNIGDYRLGQASGAPLRITGWSVNPRVLSWQSVSTGAVYRIEYAQDLSATNAWQPGPVVTSHVAGALSATNLFTSTNWIEFIRVQFVTNSP